MIFVQATKMSEPGEGALDDPALGQDPEFVGFPALDDLQGAGKHRLYPSDESARIAAVGEDHFERTYHGKQPDQQRTCTHTVLDAGGMHAQRQYPPLGVDGDVALSAFGFFAGIEASLPPFPLVFTDCASMIATLGVGSRPA